MTVLKRMQPIMLLQNYIYKQLIKANIDNDLKIYHKVPKDTNFPYAFIGEFSSKFHKLSSVDLVYVDQKINIYLRNYSLLSVFEIIDKACSALECVNSYFEGVNIKYVKSDTVQHNMMIDAKTLCITINIKARLEVANAEYEKELINITKN